MKIMVITPYYAPAVGGLENYARNIAKGLTKDGHDVFVVTTNHLTKTYQEDTVDGIKVIRLPIQFKLSNTPFHFGWKGMLKQIIAAEKPDVINAHTPVPYISDMASRAAGRVPVVLTYHNDLVKPSGIGKYLAKMFYVIYMNKTMRYARRIITTSQYYADTSAYLAKHKHKLDIVSPGVDFDRFNDKVDKTWLRKQYPGKKIILFVASMKKSHAHKGLPVLLKACAKLDYKKNPYQLVAVGSGDGIDDYKTQAKKLGISEYVSFTGYVSDEDLPKYYAGAHVFTLPSTTNAEGFGMVLIEAQACGTPVIGSNIGGIPYAIGDETTGVLVDANNSAKLASNIEYIITNGAILAKQAVERAQVSFDWVDKAKDTLKIFSETGKYRIIQITPHYPPYLGGMEQRIKELSEKLVSNGYSVTVLTSDQGAYTSEFVECGGRLRIKYLKSFEIFHTPLIPRLIPELFKIDKNSIVHIHIAVAFVPEVAGLICLLRRIPYVAHIRLDTPASGRFGAIVLPIYKKVILKPIIRRAKEIIVLTEDYRAIVKKKYGVIDSAITTIPNATYFSSPKQSRILPDKGPYRILSVGRLSSQKNFPLAIDAINILKKEHPEIKINYSIVGEGEQKNTITKLIKLHNLNEIIRLVGRAEGDQLQKIYEKSDLFLLTSTHESFGTVLIEAMAKSLPVIATKIEAVQNIIVDKRNGILCKEDPMDVADNIRRLLTNDKLYREVSAHNQEDIKMYNWDTVLKQTLGVYDKTLSK